MTIKNYNKNKETADAASKIYGYIADQHKAVMYVATKDGIGHAFVGPEDIWFYKMVSERAQNIGFDNVFVT